MILLIILPLWAKNYSGRNDAQVGQAKFNYREIAVLYAQEDFEMNKRNEIETFVGCRPRDELMLQDPLTRLVMSFARREIAHMQLTRWGGS